MKNQQTGVKYIFLRDGRGSVYQVINEDTRAIVNRYEYGDFGNIVDSTEGIENPFTYTSREWEPGLGLYYYRARWYDPSIGRFISEDPIGFAGGMNLYGYVGNNATNLTDPIGLQETPPNVGDLVENIQRYVDDFADRRIQIEIARRLTEYELDLPYGQVEEVNIFYNEITKRVISISPVNESSLCAPDTRIRKAKAVGKKPEILPPYMK